MKGSRLLGFAVGIIATFGCAQEEFTGDEHQEERMRIISMGNGDAHVHDDAAEPSPAEPNTALREAQCFTHGGPRALTLAPRGSLRTREDGTEAAVDISLRWRPRSEVTVRMTVSDPTEAIVIPDKLVISPKEWWRAHRVRIRGVGDLLADGAVPFDVVFSTRSADPIYAKLSPIHLSLTNEDAAAFASIGDFPGGDFLSSAQDVTRDGSFIVGYGTSARGREALTWNADDGIRSIADAPSSAFRVNRTGAVIVGRALDGSNRARAAVWKDGTGPQFLNYDNEDAFVRSTAVAVSGDGQVIGGTLKPWGYAATLGGLWRDAQMTNIPGLPSGLSDDGSVWVGNGTYFKASSNHYPLRNGVSLPFANFCLTPILCDAQAFDVSGDGRYVVGYSHVPAESLAAPQEAPIQAVLWDATEETVKTLSSYREATALGVSDDGRVAVGFALDDGAKAMRWANGEEHSIAELLDRAGIDREGWELTQANAVSGDGRVVVGDGVAPDGRTSGWIAILP